METEVWKDIVGYEGLYICSSFGRVVSLPKTVISGRGRFRTTTKKLLTQQKSNCGYLRVVLYKDNCPKFLSVHRIIATAFIGLPGKGMQVNHKDGHKTNNDSYNLEWVTASENERHAFRLGLKNANGANNGRAKHKAKQQELLRA